MVALDWVDLTNVASGIFIISVTGCFQMDDLIKVRIILHLSLVRVSRLLITPYDPIPL